MNQMLRHGRSAPDHDYRLGREPGLTLATLVDLGLSDEAISRFLSINAASLASLFEQYGVTRAPASRPADRCAKSYTRFRIGANGAALRNAFMARRCKG